MSRHRSARPRYGRIGLAVAAMGITVLAVLGGVGVVPTAPSAAESERLPVTASAPPSETITPEPAVQGPDLDTEAAVEIDPEALPADSGKGRRIVFSETDQRVWLVRGNGRVRRTYLVSGSVVDNLDPGRYSVYSRSRFAVGVDDSGEMEFFVRFARGQHAAIGFHTIPTKLGAALQTRAELGIPQSHGCVRQARADAISLWNFAPEGTSVVVI